MVPGISFISDNYERISNSNDVEKYRTMYHPDALWCPPFFEDKSGVDQIAFAFQFKRYNISVKVLEIEGIDGLEMSYVTGLVAVVTYKEGNAVMERLRLRGSWLVVPYEKTLVIRYQVWNQKNRV